MEVVCERFYFRIDVAKFLLRSWARDKSGYPGPRINCGGGVKADSPTY